MYDEVSTPVSLWVVAANIGALIVTKLWSPGVGEDVDVSYHLHSIYRNRQDIFRQIRSETMGDDSPRRDKKAKTTATSTANFNAIFQQLI